MSARVTPASLVALVVAAGGCIPVDRFEALECSGNDDDPRLLPGLSLEPEVDYIELRTGAGTELTVLETYGTPCATATDTAACQDALDAATGPESLILSECLSFCTKVHFVVNRGDTVEVIGDKASLLALIGTVDSAADAVLTVLAGGWSLDCDDAASGGVRATDAGWEVLATQYTSTCSPTEKRRYQLSVDPDGVIDVIADERISYDAFSCIGRRPAGLEADDDPAVCLGAWLAEIARLEAAAVHAFADLERALAAHGAPDSLRARAAEARRDERRHTRDMARLARRYGAEVRPPRVVAQPVPSLEALATENAVEGCVRETFGALVGLWQAGAATDPEIRATLTRIGADEARHAALSWAIAAWAEPKLDPEARARVEAARADAMAHLRTEVAQPVPRVLETRAGLPSAAVQRRLLDGLAAQIAA